MFSKPNKALPDSSSAQQPAPRAQVQPPQQQALTPAQSLKKPERANAMSLLSSDLIVTGTIISSGDLQIDGRIEGDVRAGTLIIGDKATIVGDVYADDALVRGRVEGRIAARKVQLAATCRVAGDILHESFSVESGAFFEGNCRHSDNPLAEAPSPAVSVRRDPRKGTLTSVGVKSGDGEPRSSAAVAGIKN